MRHLIEPCDVDKYARPCDMDDEIIARAIEEAELLDIKPKLGDELFMRLLTHVQFAVLLNGAHRAAPSASLQPGSRRAGPYQIVLLPCPASVLYIFLKFDGVIPITDLNTLLK